MCSGLFLHIFFLSIPNENLTNKTILPSIVHKYMLGAACFSLAGLERHEMLL